MAPDPASQMRAKWQRFAREDAMYYIHCGRDDWDRASFFADGRSSVDALMRWVGPDVVDRDRMLEIGCGLGRLSAAFGGYFRQVDAVDISAEMVATARTLDPPANLEFHVGSGQDLERFPDHTFDFVASLSVFQHIPDEAVIGHYLVEIARVLKPGGSAVLHLDTRPGNRLRQAIYALPDAMLPRTSRRYMRRYPRDAARVRELARNAGLAIVRERAPDTDGHQLLLVA